VQFLLTFQTFIVHHDLRAQQYTEMPMPTKQPMPTSTPNAMQIASASFPQN
jgi:hypothetical protein